MQVRNCTVLIFLAIVSAISLDAVTIVMRHGESTHNVQEFFNSNPNHPNYRPSFLTPHGIHEIKESCKQLLAQGINSQNVAEAYVSPLPRTIQTAAILIEMGVIAHDKIKIDNRLIEVQMGNREGKSWHNFEQNPWDISPSTAELYEGESYVDVTNRVVALLLQIRKENPAGNVILITHGSPALQLVEYALHEHNIVLPPAGFKIIE